jgi:hypothetical protein
MFTLCEFQADLQTSSSQRAGLSRIVSFLGALALFGPSAALAQQGTITGLEVEPPSAISCQTIEKITVTGTGSCPGGAITIDTGDNQPAAPYKAPSFPFTIYHTYRTNSGFYKIKAQGQGTCSGASTFGLNVYGPTVTSVYPLSVIKPLGAVILLGQHFGSLPGQFLIHVTNYKGQSIDLPLDGVQWGDTFVSGTIPPMSGVLKQQAIFTVIARCGAWTAWEATFNPLTSWVQIAFEQVTCSTSIGAGPSDRCQNWGNTNYPFECWVNPTYEVAPGEPNSYYGFHASGWGGGNSGYDQFWPSPPLKNDWGYDSYTLDWYDLGGGSNQTVTGVNTSNPAAPVLSVNWHVDACGVVEYGGVIFITGPANVPY